jgi:catechol 2,3-dioxygenase-like lactoylglutathione lyase family enzyme
MRENIMPLTHITIGAKDPKKSAAFYAAALGVVGYSQAFANDHWTGFSCGEGNPPLLVGKPYAGEAQAANGLMLGFAADSRAKVRDAHAAGLKAGGTDDGAPGLRPAGPPNTYAAYLRDPSGNKIGIFCNKPGE